MHGPGTGAPLLEARLLTHALPKLPYAYDALEPYSDRATVELHYAKHHQTYVDNLNKLLEGHPELAKKSIEALLGDLNAIPEDARQGIINQGGGHYNHTQFWEIMGPNAGGDPSGAIAPAIDSAFGKAKDFRDKFKASALGMFGSGWTYLVATRDGKLQIQNFPNQNCPLSLGQVPLLGLDVWEHAYYLKYQNRRAEWIDAWWNVLNWSEVNKRWAAAQGK